MKILCLGSLNLDFVYNVDHFVQAGETIAALERNQFCGGKGSNQAISLARAGANVFMAGRIGKDGDVLRERLVANGADVSLLEVDDEIPTGHAIIEVDPSGQNCIIICGGANRTIDEAFIDRALEGFGASDIILLQNEISGLDYAIKRATEKGIGVALNPSPLDDALKNSPALDDVDWFIINELEGCELTGETEPEAICKAMRSKYPKCIVVLTLGVDGVMYYDGSNAFAQAAYDVKPVDTTGAGDAFTGFFLAGIGDGLTVPAALKLASKAAAISVTRPGAADSIPSRAEVDAAEL